MVRAGKCGLDERGSASGGKAGSSGGADRIGINTLRDAQDARGEREPQSAGGAVHAELAVHAEGALQLVVRRWAVMILGGMEMDLRDARTVIGEGVRERRCRQHQQVQQREHGRRRPTERMDANAHQGRGVSDLETDNLRVALQRARPPARIVTFGDGDPAGPEHRWLPRAPANARIHRASSRAVCSAAARASGHGEGQLHAENLRVGAPNSRSFPHPGQGARSSAPC
jgi:hypothetical protein